MTAQHFAFTKLVVGDLDNSAAFYEAVFGLKPQARINAEIGGRAITEIVYEATGKGGAAFVLLAFNGVPRPAKGEVIVGFACDDVDAVVARATAAGGAVFQAARDAPEHGLRVGFLTDPEGHLIELIKPL